MSERSKQLLQAVLELPREEQLWIADELHASIDDMTEEEFKAELKRRRDECLNDPDASVPWTVLKSIK